MDKVWNKIESRSLVYGGTWEDAQSSIRAKVFGVMVELAKDRIKYYLSDLYHDALWINEYLIGPMEIEWIVRESGTFIGDVTRYVKDDEWTNSVRYRFDIRDDNDRKWVLDIHEAGPLVPQVVRICEECGVNSGAQFVDWLQMWLCSDYCSGKAENRVNTAKSLPTDIDYSENEAYQIQLEKACTSNDPTDHQGDTCPVHEDLGAKYRDAMQEEFTLPEEFHPYFSNEPLSENMMDDTIKMLFAKAMGNPTLRNESTIEPQAQTRKENNMESIIRDLREKYDEASNSKDQLEEYQGNINDAVDELDTYMSDLDDLISSLDQLPEISVYVDLDTVSFDS